VEILINLNKEKLKRLNLPDYKLRTVPSIYILDKYTPYTDVFDKNNIRLLDFFSSKYDVHGMFAGQVIQLILNETQPKLHLSGYTSDIEFIIDYCMFHNIRIINASIDFRYSKESEKQLKRYADWGGIFVTSSGNTSDEVTYPGSSEYTIAVGSPNYATGKGSMLDCKAESDWIVRNKNGGFIPFTHSSGSCPVISAVVAILLDMYPSWRLDDLRRFIRDNNKNSVYPANNTKIFAFPYNLFPPERIYNSTTIEMLIGENKYYVNGSKRFMDTAPFIKDKRTFVPIRFVAEALGYKVDWNEKEKKIVIK